MWSGTAPLAIDRKGDFFVTKARFDAPQPGVQVKTFGDKSYIYISPHETEGTERTERGEYRYYEYDYHEFCEKTANLDINNIHTHPEKYLNYRPKKEPTEAERIKSLEEQNQMLTDCVLEMSMLLYQ